MSKIWRDTGLDNLVGVSGPLLYVKVTVLTGRKLVNGHEYDHGTLRCYLCDAENDKLS